MLLGVLKGNGNDIYKKRHLKNLIVILDFVSDYLSSAMFCQVMFIEFTKKSTCVYV